MAADTFVVSAAPDTSALCQSCGACCSHSRDWPRFSTECDADLDLIPVSLVRPDLGGMRCEGDRCAALAGVVGKAVSCTIWGLRPDVCRACMPGDEECNVARAKLGLVLVDRGDLGRLGY